MTDPTTPNHDQPVEGSRSESYTRPDAGNLGGSTGSSGWTGAPDADSGAAAKANDVLDTLRETVEDLAERATPLLREFSAKAAEILASAADKAAPLAHKAGDVTADAEVHDSLPGHHLARELGGPEVGARDEHGGDSRQGACQQGRAAPVAVSTT